MVSTPRLKAPAITVDTLLIGQVLMPNPEFLAEVADLKKKEIELTDLVSSRETEIKNLTEEFNQLDSYTNLLQVPHQHFVC